MVLSFNFGQHSGHQIGYIEGMKYGRNMGNCEHVSEWKEYMSDGDTYTIIIHKCK